MGTWRRHQRQPFKIQFSTPGAKALASSILFSATITFLLPGNIYEKVSNNFKEILRARIPTTQHKSPSRKFQWILENVHHSRMKSFPRIWWEFFTRMLAITSSRCQKNSFQEVSTFYELAYWHFQVPLRGTSVSKEFLWVFLSIGFFVEPLAWKHFLFKPMKGKDQPMGWTR